VRVRIPLPESYHQGFRSPRSRVTAGRTAGLGSVQVLGASKQFHARSAVSGHGPVLLQARRLRDCRDSTHHAPATTFDTAGRLLRGLQKNCRLIRLLVLRNGGCCLCRPDPALGVRLTCRTAQSRNPTSPSLVVPAETCGTRPHECEGTASAVRASKGCGQTHPEITAGQSTGGARRQSERSAQHPGTACARFTPARS
jgi:hypothetical protein